MAFGGTESFRNFTGRRKIKEQFAAQTAKFSSLRAGGVKPPLH
jgi:hypothetical protein